MVDGLIIEGDYLSVYVKKFLYQESKITGDHDEKDKLTIEESDSKSFDASKLIIFRGSRITSGDGYMVVLNVGLNLL